MALSKGCTIHFTLVAAEMVVLLIRGVVDFLRARCLSKRGVSATNDARKKKKKAGTDEIRTREVSHHGLVET